MSLIISLVFVSIAARKTLKYGEDHTGPLSPPEHQEHHVSTHGGHHHHHNGSARDVSMSESARPSMTVDGEKPHVIETEKALGTAQHV